LQIKKTIELAKVGSIAKRSGHYQEKNEKLGVYFSAKYFTKVHRFAQEVGQGRPKADPLFAAVAGGVKI